MWSLVNVLHELIDCELLPPRILSAHEQHWSHRNSVPVPSLCRQLRSWSLRKIIRRITLKYSAFLTEDLVACPWVILYNIDLYTHYSDVLTILASESGQPQLRCSEENLKRHRWSWDEFRTCIPTHRNRVAYQLPAPQPKSKQAFGSPGMSLAIASSMPGTYFCPIISSNMPCCLPIQGVRRW